MGPDMDFLSTHRSWSWQFGSCADKDHDVSGNGVGRVWGDSEWKPQLIASRLCAVIPQGRARLTLEELQEEF